MDFRSIVESIADGKGADSVPVFLVGGGDLNERSSSGWTLLHAACEYWDHAMIDALVLAGADLNARDSHGWTPLHLAIDSDIDYSFQVGEPLEFENTRRLLKAGADRTIADDKGRTADDLAKSYGAAAYAKYQDLCAE